MAIDSTDEEKRVVLSFSRPCPYPEWLLLELPNGLWAAFWSEGLDIENASAVANGKYRDGCSYRSRSKERVLKHMAEHRLR